MTPEEIEERVQRAMGFHEQSFNCAQCVALATCDLVSLDADMLFRVTEGLGGGLGGFSETCGAINGMAVILSYANCHGMELHDSKASTYRLVKEGVDAFRAKNDDTLCQDLRPTNPHEIKAACNGYISDCVRLVCKAVG